MPRRITIIAIAVLFALAVAALIPQLRESSAIARELTPAYIQPALDDAPKAQLRDDSGQRDEAPTAPAAQDSTVTSASSPQANTRKAAGCVLQFILTDDSGAAIDCASFVIELESGYKQWRLESAAGEYSIASLASGTWSCAVHVDGEIYLESARHVEVELHPDSIPVPVTFVRGAFISGEVLAHDGSSGAEYLIQAVADTTGAFVYETEDGGLFKNWMLPPGAFALQIEAFGQVYILERVSLAAGQHIEGLRLQLDVGGGIDGIVIDAGGTPVPDRHVGLMCTASEVVINTYSDQDGRFRFDLVPAGHYIMTASPSDAEKQARMQEGVGERQAILELMARADVDMPDKGRLQIVLQPKSMQVVELSGRVLLAGKPVEAEILAFLEGTSLVDSVRSGKSGADGRYNMRLGEPGPYLILVGLSDYHDAPSVPFEVHIPAKARHSLDLALPGGSLSGHVVDSAGRPVRGAPVEVFNERGAGLVHLPDTTIEQRTNSRGRYEHRMLPPGTYTVQLPGRAVLKGVRLDAGEAREDVNLTVPNTGIVRGVVVDSTGAPVAGAGIYLRSAAGEALCRDPLCTSDNSGAFNYSAAASGVLLISARTAQATTLVEKEVQISPGEVSVVKLQLRPGTWLRVAARKGRDAHAVHVEAYTESGLEVGTLSAPERDARVFRNGLSRSTHDLGPFPPGVLRVVAYDAQGVRMEQTVTLPRKKPLLFDY